MKTASLSVWLVTCTAFCAFYLTRGSAAAAAASEEIYIVEASGIIEIWLVGANRWIGTVTNQFVRPGDRLRTGRNSSVALRWSDQSIARFGPETEMEILPPHKPNARFGVNLIKGLLSFFHRDKPNRIQVITRGAVAGVDGTEFVVNVEPIGNTEETTLFVIDGIVRLGNEHATLVLTNGQAATARPGQAPVLIAGFIANNIMQWALYYPAILNPADLSITADESAVLAKSLEAYRQGDLLTALREYPEDRKPASDAERVYHAALLVNVGQIDDAAAELREIRGSDTAPLADALRQMIAAVKREAFTPARPPQLATELLAGSYYEQSQATGDPSLRAALRLAREATEKSPEFGFAWARVAELEFSFGRIRGARLAVEKALALTPRNAQALSLQGFLYLANNKPREAIKWFDKAIATDAALGNAWLGRGLARIRTRQAEAGREDLLVAAALEPQRSLLRSYLGKAYRDPAAAEHELELARTLDPKDPTPLLYAALIKAQNNRINEAIRDLEKSQELNENRRVFRSQLLVDQDRSVRSANLASIYRDAGMQDWAVFEASRAVSADYGNYSAHLFLANSYDELRDPNRINLRYETPASAEYLLANLLSPVGAETLPQSVSQQDYLGLFERDRFGLASTTEYLSRGAWQEQGAQYGTFGNTSYALSASYRTDPGQRSNNDFEERVLRAQVKQQLSPRDSLYAHVEFYEASGGDLLQLYDNNRPNRHLRVDEDQEGLALMGYHHEWQPGVHTLFLAGRLPSRIGLENPSQVNFLVERAPEGIVSVEPFTANQRYRRTTEIYSAEAQQIFHQASHTTILGGRLQSGDFNTRNFQKDPVSENLIFIIPDSETPLAEQEVTTDFQRATLYAYQTWNVVEPLTVIAGITYDQVTFPENFRAAPILKGEETIEDAYPKAGVIWKPGESTVVRAAYSRSVTGASIDQSIQLEPTQVAGFLQSYRSIIPESVAGAQAGAEFETYGVSIEQRFPSGTYLGLAGQVLAAEMNRTLGAFHIDFAGFAYTNIGGIRDEIDYEEKSLLFTANQLLGQSWAIGLRYRVTEAELQERYPEVLDTAILVNNFRADQTLDATLHDLNLHLAFNHASGIFSSLEAVWYDQSNAGYSPGRPGDEFWHFNLFAGYRFPKRRAELQIALLNITDHDYRLNPLTLYNDVPRERTLAVRWRMNF